LPIFPISAQLTFRFLRRPLSRPSTDSIEIAQSQYFTPKLLAEFAVRRGYDLTPYLPLLLDAKPHFFAPVKPSFVSLDDTWKRVRHDFYHTISDLYLENRVLGLNKMASSLNLVFRNQPYGFPLDMAKSAYLVDSVEGETLCFSSNPHDAFRILATGRDVAGKTILSDELAAVIGMASWKSSGRCRAVADLFFSFRQDYKATWRWLLEQANEHFALGVNQVRFLSTQNSLYIPLTHLVETRSRYTVCLTPRALPRLGQATFRCCRIRQFPLSPTLGALASPSGSVRSCLPSEKVQH
jgi:hypothetical protein